MYPYHNVIKKRIKNGELIAIKKIKDESFAFVFIFSCYPYTRPIRHTSVDKYKDVVDNFKNLIEE